MHENRHGIADAFSHDACKICGDGMKMFVHSNGYVNKRFG